MTLTQLQSQCDRLKELVSELQLSISQWAEEMTGANPVNVEAKSKVDLIRLRVAGHYGITTSQLISSDRHQHIADARRVYIYILSYYLHMRPKDIIKTLPGYHPSTVAKAAMAIVYRLGNEFSFRGDFELLIIRLNNESLLK